MRVVQLSDTHLMPGGAPFREIADTSAALARAAETIAGLAERVGPIDLVLVTGDLVEEGDAESYARFRELTAAIPAPMAVIPGNHDDREELRAAFADQPQMPRSGPVNWRLDLRGATVVGLDSLVDGAPHGALPPETLDWLRRAIAGLPDTPLIVAVHHPPFPVGIPFMDGIGLRAPEALLAILAERFGPTLLVAGHVHRTVMATGGHKAMAIAPSPSHAIALDADPEAPLTLTLEPGGVLLHELRQVAGQPRFVSQLVPVGPAPESRPFVPES